MKEVSELIGSEISAIKSLDSVLNRLSDSKDLEALKTLREDHHRAVEKLKDCIGSDYREEATAHSGPWGSFATSFEGEGSILKDRIAVKALKIGEEFSVNNYRKILKNESLSKDVRRVIETEILPQQEKHLATVNGYLH